MNLNVNDDQLNAIVAASIMAAITPESREKLIGEAVRKLIVPDTSGYGSKESPLQAAFKNAVNDVARTTVREKLANDESVKAMIDGVISDALKRVLETDREKTVERVAGGISAWLTFEGDRR